MKFILSLSLSTLAFASMAQCGNSPNVVTYSYDGHDYELIQETLTWEQAAACAVSRGGHLAHINSEEEHDTLYAWLSNDPNVNPNGTIDVFGASSIWLGGTDKANEGDWIWDGNDTGIGASFWSGNFNGSAVNGSFDAWGVIPPEPDNSGGNQNYLTWRLTGNNTSLWNDLHPSGGLFFLVEIDPNTSSLEENTESKNIHVYPNPVSTDVHITLTNEMVCREVQLADASGVVVLQKDGFTSQEFTLDVSAFSAGMYVLILDFENGGRVQQEVVVE